MLCYSYQFSVDYYYYALLMTMGKDWSKIVSEFLQQNILLKVESLLLNFPF